MNDSSLIISEYFSEDSTIDTNTLKIHLRKYFKEQLSVLSNKFLSQAGIHIFDYLINLNILKNSKKIFVFLSMDSEINTHSFIEYLLWETDKEIYVPKIINHEMKLVRIKNFLDLEENDLGFLEPTNTTEFYTEKDIDLAIIPALSFDEFGFRLGRGGGYYDKYLKEYNSYNIGICLSEFVNLAFSYNLDEWDQKVDALITYENLDGNYYNNTVEFLEFKK